MQIKEATDMTEQPSNKIKNWNNKENLCEHKCIYTYSIYIYLMLYTKICIPFFASNFNESS
jgi:hypothetical protein